MKDDHNGMLRKLNRLRTVLRMSDALHARATTWFSALAEQYNQLPPGARRDLDRAIATKDWSEAMHAEAQLRIRWEIRLPQELLSDGYTLHRELIAAGYGPAHRLRVP